MNRFRPYQVPNLSAARAFAFWASSSRFFGAALVSSDVSSRVEMPAISSIAARNTPSLALDGLLNPLIFLTNWSEAARTSSSVTGGSKLNRVLIFLHTPLFSHCVGGVFLVVADVLDHFGVGEKLELKRERPGFRVG